VERVPARPAIPNGAVRERLRELRGSVLERLDSDGDDTDAADEPTDPLAPLDAARSLRGDAAAVEGAYRAATNAVTPRAVADRRARLRSALLAFERDWTYRGADPASAAVVHRALEGCRDEVRPALAPERAFPADPTTDVLGVGELVRDLERGRAALADAERLRTRYREGLSDPRSYRTPVSVAAGRLHRRCRQYSRELEGYLDPDPGELPFDRSVEGTPLERLYRWGRDGVDVFRADATAARQRGDRATALIATGVYLTVLRALATIVVDVRNGRVTAPESVDGVATARREAIDALVTAWSTAPTVLATEVAHWSWRLIDFAGERLGGHGDGTPTPDTRDAHDAWAIYVTAARVATAVPPTVADARAPLRAATT
jgi:hypothetical protein